MAEQTDKRPRNAFASTSGGFVSPTRLEAGPDALRDLGAHMMRRMSDTRADSMTSTALKAR